MAFGDVRKCPVCPAYWIEDDQMYEDPAVCPQCGTDSSDFMNQYARGKSSNLSRELLLNPGGEYFAGQIDDGKTNIFENWDNYYITDTQKVEAVSDCYEGGAAVKISSDAGPQRYYFVQNIYNPLMIAGGNFRFKYRWKGDGVTSYAKCQIAVVGGTGSTFIIPSPTSVWTLAQLDVAISVCTHVEFQLGVFGSGSRYCFIDACSVKKILTD